MRNDRPHRQFILGTLLTVFLHPGLAADDAPASRTHSALTVLFGQLIDGGEWRTPNPDYDDANDAAKEYILRYRWGPHRQHMVGELLGHFEAAGGPTEILFWSLYAIHNPVTDEVRVSQVGSNGALATGRIWPAGDKHVIEQILYAPEGSMKALRHEEAFATDGESFTSQVFERDDRGGWKKVRDWVWTRQHH